MTPRSGPRPRRTIPGFGTRGLSARWVLPRLTKKWRCAHHRGRQWHPWHSNHAEVDLVIEVSSKLWGVEVKAAASVNASDGRGLHRMAQIAGRRFQGGLVLYDGDAVPPIVRERNILAAPLKKLWGD